MVVTLAGGVICNEIGDILLLHRNTEKRQQWELPGGKLEENEHPRNAAIRELKEELGIRVEIIAQISMGEYKEDGVAMEYTWYECDIKEGIPKIMESKFDALKYWNILELDEIFDELSANMKNLLPFLKRSHYEGSLQ